MKKRKIDLESLSPEERAQRRKRNKRFNRILYTVSALLITVGLVIIISDTTYFFKDAGDWIVKTYNETVNHITPVPEPTLPAIQPMTYDPSITLRPWNEHDAHASPQPGNNSGGSWQSGGLVTNNPYAPVQVHFVGHNISCPVDPVAYNSNGQMDVVRSAYRAGWFIYGGDPVSGGNVLIAGHNKYSGKLGYFAVIKSGLKTGDYVIVEMKNGEHAYYVVRSIESYEYNAVPDSVMTTGGAPRLTLITCYGDYSSAIGTSRHRVIAVCDPVYFGGQSTGQTEAPKNTPAPQYTEIPKATPAPQYTELPQPTPAPQYTELPQPTPAPQYTPEIERTTAPSDAPEPQPTAEPGAETTGQP